MSLNKKIALVTGGGKGLGTNAAKNLSEQGASIVLTYHTLRIT